MAALLEVRAILPLHGQNRAKRFDPSDRFDRVPN
jgi:hypothetical protein